MVLEVCSWFLEVYTILYRLERCMVGFREVLERCIWRFLQVVAYCVDWTFVSKVSESKQTFIENRLPFPGFGQLSQSFRLEVHLSLTDVM